jgi:hypothetical protein
MDATDRLPAPGAGRKKLEPEIGRPEHDLLLGSEDADLENRVSGASWKVPEERAAIGEMIALRRVARLLCPTRCVPALEELVVARAFTDAAIAVVRDGLPDHGFKLVISPARAGLSETHASVWRRGNTHVIAHRGATPAMALLRAAECEWKEEHSAKALATCTRCRGLGWYIAATGVKQLCRHRNS